MVAIVGVACTVKPHAWSPARYDIVGHNALPAVPEIGCNLVYVLCCRRAVGSNMHVAVCRCQALTLLTESLPMELVASQASRSSARWVQGIAVLRTPWGVMVMSVESSPVSVLTIVCVEAWKSECACEFLRELLPYSFTHAYFSSPTVRMRHPVSSTGWY